MQQDHQHQQKMGRSGAVGPGSAGSTGGGGVLARFLSAPASASWLDALLLELDEPQPQQQTPPPVAASARPPAAPKPMIQSPPELPLLGRSNSISDPTSFLDSAFSRHNSCPPEFLARLASDDLFSASDFDASSTPDAPSSHKRPRESEPSQNPSSQSSAVVSDMELDSLFQDSVPCRVRAKRGCATHPRSIAERVRRTRISDRIRKLQEVVPNMEKQTNTADMLEEAVEYVKTLQKQVQAEFYDISHPQTWQDLVDHQKKCKCLGRE